MTEFSGERLLFVGGGEESAPGIEHAKRLGLRTLVLDRNPTAPGSATAENHLQSSIFDLEAAVSLSREEHARERIDGVVSVATDAPRTVAAIADALGLPSIGTESARLVSDKLAMKECFIAAGVATAAGRRVESGHDAASVVEELGEIVVIKPIDSRGARGVSIARTGADLLRHFDEAQRASEAGVVLVEEYLAGPQYSTESVVHDGRIATVGISTRNYGRLAETYPYPVEDGGNLPAELSPDIRREIDELLLAAATALGIESGTVKGDLVLSAGKMRIIELAGRLSGGYFATHEIPLSTGVDLLEAAYKISLGYPIDFSRLRPSRTVPVAQRYFFPVPGRVTSVNVPENLRVDPDIALLLVRVAAGDIVPAITNHPARAGLVITTGTDAVSAIRRAERAVREVEIVTVPL